MSEDKKSEVRTSAAKVFFSNPVLVSGLILGPVVVCATSLQNAAALSIAFAMIVIPVLFLSATVGKVIPKPLRVVCYVVLGALMLIPIQMIISEISPIIFDSLGIYLPLIAVSSVVVAYTSRHSEKHSGSVALMDGVFFSLGFAMTTGILGFLREWLGSGTIWGAQVSSFKAPALLLPFSGFIMLGFMAAAMQGIKELLKKRDGSEETDEEPDGEEDME